MLISENAITEVVGTLKGEDFYRPAHTIIFQTIVDLYGAGEPADTITVSAELAKRGLLQRIGGAPYLLTCTQTMPTAVNIGYYARLVSEKARLRKLVQLGARWQQLGYSDTSSAEDVDATLAEAEEFFRGMQEPAQGATLFGDLIDEWQTSQQSQDDIIPTPWPEINDCLGGGFRRGKVYIWAGRPGGGKSVSGLNIATHSAEAGLSVMIFSMEMRKKEIVSRLLAGGAWANYGEIFRKAMTQDTWHKVEEYLSRHRGINLRIVDRSSLTVEEIAAHIREYKPDIAFVDYFQLITGTAGDNRREKLDHISRTLKITAGDCDVALVVASQLKRPDTQSGIKAPTISDLRESGGQEQDADVVVLLHRPDNDDGTVRMIVGKNRDGPMKSFSFVFRGSIARIGD